MWIVGGERLGLKLRAELINLLRGHSMRLVPGCVLGVSLASPRIPRTVPLFASDRGAHENACAAPI